MTEQIAPPINSIHVYITGKTQSIVVEISSQTEGLEVVKDQAKNMADFAISKLRKSEKYLDD